MKRSSAECLEECLLQNMKWQPSPSLLHCSPPIAALLLQVRLHAPFHPLRWNFCILHFTSKRTLPTQKGQHHTEHGSVRVPDIYYLHFSGTFHMDRNAAEGKAELKLLTNTAMRTISKSRSESPGSSVVSQLSTCSRWRGTSCSSNISQTPYCLQIQRLAKKKPTSCILVLEIRTQPREQIGGKWLCKPLGTKGSCHKRLQSSFLI